MILYRNAALKLIRIYLFYSYYILEENILVKF
jgi:hypothetical protein